MLQEELSQGIGAANGPEVWGWEAWHATASRERKAQEVRQVWGGVQ